MLGLEKGLAVIACFDAGHPRLTIADVARMTGLSRATARRCLITLARIGYAETDGRHFALTPRVLQLGYAYLSSTPLTAVLQNALERLSEEIGESSSASLLDGRDIVYVARAATKRIMSVGLSVGSRLPAYCTSMGRVLLAALPEDEARRRVEASDRRALTRATATSVEAVMARVAAARTAGYAVIDQELEVGLTSIAVPVIDREGKVVAAINVGTQATRFPPGIIVTEILPKLLKVQAELARIV
ncbi:IclR family transcriptional regulator domain-containing protein [Phreatobacter oligotrophus]|uniref:IclR family transcriptional regulator domain-containing protein n=1 Tax=Phreatobacter oligotrophus TaxID=1122261 RepID=UPI00235316CF|nr:IclR family transcriptional regulator C-terminal domain-containing protein [Phreatobacter oligotrophus]MBX9991968.1 helix-turn-helix domain-containing protein [Phreatobacter oligotrophus]